MLSSNKALPTGRAIKRCILIMKRRGLQKEHLFQERNLFSFMSLAMLNRTFLACQGMTIVSSQAVSNAKKMEWPLNEVSSGIYRAEAPGGYNFFLEDRESPNQGKGCGKLHNHQCHACSCWYVSVATFGSFSGPTASNIPALMPPRGNKYSQILWRFP